MKYRDGGGGEKCLDSGNILKVQTILFVTRLKVGYKRKH